MIRKAIVLFLTTSAFAQDEEAKAFEVAKTAFATHLKTMEQARIDAETATDKAEKFFENNELPDEDLEAEAAKKKT
jgi:hypothetical protein